MERRSPISPPALAPMQRRVGASQAPAPRLRLSRSMACVGAFMLLVVAAAALAQPALLPDSLPNRSLLGPLTSGFS